jgi:hypothetical protein
LASSDFELIPVNDGSPDGTWVGIGALGSLTNMERDISRNGHGRFLTSMVGIQPEQNRHD